MKILTDTHTLVWALATPEAHGTEARAALTEYPFTASVANFWELILKRTKPGALVTDPLAWWEKYVLGLASKDAALARYGAPVVW